MNTIRNISLFLCLLLPALLSAQDNSGKKAIKENVFTGKLYVGMLNGEKESQLLAHAIGGLRRGNWFAGVGTGLDYYYFRSVPVFLSLSRDFRVGIHHFFLQGDGGINFPWTDEAGRPRTNEISRNFSPGFYWNGDLGFAANVGHPKNRLLISVGYSYKKLREKRELAIFCTNPPCTPEIEEYNYYLRRLSLKLGWQFGLR